MFAMAGQSTFVDGLRRIIEHRASLSLEEAKAMMQSVLDGGVEDVQLAAFLGALASRGETAEELAGFALAMREASVVLPLTDAERDEVVDTCGTGGDGSGTFNISTAAALVAAAAGAKVAKHGNKAVTSQSGSADVLDALGIPTTLAPDAACEALRRHGFCFLLAPAHHPAMRAVLPVRRALGVRTVLHALGPLLNPAGARRQVMGVYSARLVPVVAEAMTMLGVRHAFVVHGDGGPSGGQDELALSGSTEVAEVREAQAGRSRVREYRFRPEDAGLQRAPLSALAGGDAAANAAILSAVFAGEQGPRRDVVVLNAAAVLVTAGLAEGMLAAVQLAAATMDSGAVSALVQQLASTK